MYTAEWSVADPWTFASLSYDGRLVIGKGIKKKLGDITCPQRGRGITLIRYENATS